MQDRAIAEKDKFLVKVGLAIFLTGGTPKIGLVKNKDGKYRVPSQDLSTGENCFDVANKVLNESCGIDRTSPFSLELATCISDSEQLYLIFSLYVKQGSDFNEELVFFDSEESADLYFKNEFDQNHGEVVRAAIQNG